MPGHLLSQRYLLLMKLGKGTFTTIYSSFDLHTQKNVAIKVENISPEIKPGSVLEKEASVLSSLTGGRYCPLFHTYVTDGTSSAVSSSSNSRNDLCYIVFELLNGEDMHEFRIRTSKVRQEGEVKKRRFMPIQLEGALHLAEQMLDCVENVHSKGYLHRDVKPGNFVRTGTDSASRDFKIIDFGLSKSFLQPYDPSLPSTQQIPFQTPSNYSEKMYLKPQRPNASFRGTTMYASVKVQSSHDHQRSDDIFGVLYSFIDLVNGDLPWRVYATGEGKDKDKVLMMKVSGLKDPRSMMVDERVRSLGNFNHWIWKATEYLSKLPFHSTPDYEYIKTCLRNACEGDGRGPVTHTKWDGRKDADESIQLVWECKDQKRLEALGLRLSESLTWRKNRLLMSSNLLSSSSSKLLAWNIGANYILQRSKLDLSEMTFLQEYAKDNGLIKHFGVKEGERNAITCSSINSVRLDVLIKEKKRRKEGKVEDTKRIKLS